MGGAGGSRLHHGADGGLPELGPAAVGVDLLQPVVHELLGRRVVERQPDPVGLLRERLPDDLDRRVPARGGDEDALVDDVGVGPALLQRGEALGVVLQQDRVRLRGELLQREHGRRVGLGDHVLAVEVADARDGGVVGPHRDRGPRLVVRPGERDLLRARLGDRVRGEHRVDVAVLDQGLAGVDRGDHQFDGVGVRLARDVVGEHGREPGVEPGDLARGRVLQREQRALVGAAADQLPALLDLVGPRAGGDRGGVRDRRPGDDLVVAAGVGLAGHGRRRGGARVGTSGEDQPPSRPPRPRIRHLRVRATATPVAGPATHPSGQPGKRVEVRQPGARSHSDHGARPSATGPTARVKPGTVGCHQEVPVLKVQGTALRGLPATSLIALAPPVRVTVYWVDDESVESGSGS